MATSLNRITLIGFLGRDPELRQAGDRAVAEFSLATNEEWTDREGNKKTQTDWHRIVVWGRSGENCAKYLSKGSMCYVEGSMRYRDWTDKDGNKRTTAEIVASSVQFLDRKPAGDDGPRRGNSAQSSRPNQLQQSLPQDSPPHSDAFNDDDIPF